MSDLLAPLRERLARNGAALSKDAEALLVAYHDLLVALNWKYALVSPGDEARIASRHFVESAGLLRWIPEGPARVLDFGAGGGLPGIVIRILRPAAQVVLLEARERKQDFLRHAVRTLGLSGTAVAASVEDLALAGAAPRKGSMLLSGPALFDRIVARSVAPLGDLLIATTPLLSHDGLLLAAKGSRVQEEIEQAAPLLDSLGLQWLEQRVDPLTTREGERIGLSTLVFRKARHT